MQALDTQRFAIGSKADACKHAVRQQRLQRSPDPPAQTLQLAKIERGRQRMQQAFLLFGIQDIRQQLGHGACDETKRGLNYARNCPVQANTIFLVY
ncbi:hypothetical protein ACFFTM_04790 [Pseudoduganella plicata]